jgi:hypothetical protein
MRIAIAAAPRTRAKAEAGTPGSLDLTGDGGPFRSGGRRRDGARGIGDLGFRWRAAGGGYRDCRRGNKQIKERGWASGEVLPRRRRPPGSTAEAARSGRKRGRCVWKPGRLEGKRRRGSFMSLQSGGVRGGRSDFRGLFTGVAPFRLERVWWADIAISACCKVLGRETEKEIKSGSFVGQGTFRLPRLDLLLLLCFLFLSTEYCFEKEYCFDDIFRQTFFKKEEKKILVYLTKQIFKRSSLKKSRD